MRLSIILIVSLVLSLAACAGSKSSSPPPADEAIPSAADAQAVQPPAGTVAVGEDAPSIPEFMNDHFVAVADVRDAIVNGDLADAQARANSLVLYPTAEGIPEEWLGSIAKLRLAAKEVAGAPSLATAAEASARMVRSCGECHEAVVAAVKFPEVPLVSLEDDVVDHMWEHKWALDRLWEGLATPSEARWRGGAETLSGAALKALGPESADEAVTMVQDLANRVHDLGKRAAEVDRADWAMYYGELLGTCAECHSVMNRGQ